jgi:hypothetical protein
MALQPTPHLQRALTRALLFVLIEAPILSLFVGFFFRWVSFPDSNLFALALGFAVLPAVALRLARTAGGSEVLREFPKYALCSLFPYTLYNIFRIPMHYLLDIVFWDHWFDFGSGITGAPSSTWQAFVSGTLAHSLQGYVLALGFYVLCKPSLRNALLWGIFLSALYSWLYPTYVLVDFAPPPKWFYVVWWGHFWMGIGLWATPKFLYSPTLMRWAKGYRLRMGVLVLGVVALYATPYAFVTLKVATWQFPLQETLDRRTQQQLQVSLAPPVVLLGVAPDESTGTRGDPRRQEASYHLTLQVGSRIWTDYIKATKAVEIAPLVVHGRLLHNGNVIATCFAFLEELESAGQLTRYQAYIQKVKEIEYTVVPVQCGGLWDAVPEDVRMPEGAGVAMPVTVYWAVHMRVKGDRLREDVMIEGNAEASLAGR